MQNRRVTYKMYPTKAQEVELELIHDKHRKLSNACIEERISAWSNKKLSISYVDQAKSLTQIRRDDPDYRVVNAQSLQSTLKRVDRAFQAFFTRSQKGAKAPGFPRFKSKNRFSGWGYNAHGDGFKFIPGPNWKHGVLRLSGVGKIKVRGEARTPGRIVKCDIMRKGQGLWFCSVVLECEPYRERTGDLKVGFDWGVSTYGTLGYDLDHVVEIPNDRLYQQESESIKEKQRALSKSSKGRKKSKTVERKRKLLAKAYRKLVNSRKNRTHQTSAKLVREHSLIVTEKLDVQSMTQSMDQIKKRENSKETKDKNGFYSKTDFCRKNVLNREILDTSPFELLKQLTYKAEEAGCELIILDTRECKPSQRDPISFEIKKKGLDERKHTLPNGTVIGRDHAAALVMLRLGLNQMGREPAWIEPNA